MTCTLQTPPNQLEHLSPMAAALARHQSFHTAQKAFLKYPKKIYCTNLTGSNYICEVKALQDGEPSHSEILPTEGRL